ncbi:hypothetical protein D3874_05460 [Oleomonas cavernae]|uniref:DUF3739 domain-containing protein n=1 Tax=Oleomonas cavernae TaxID=2320859 RepID=A0A418W973_9PROT|nr:hypothetical protein [Oleomonas cavernae]RJF86536.1 hypothetical protein D3874_05460 [Oleomonas cavernae]
MQAGSTTSITAGGQSIPYGITTDGTEWFFAPTSADPLTKPPGGTLRIGGQDIVMAAGATIDLSGGGDVFAYEFVPGTGGSYDVLSRLNGDASTGNDGLQYADGRQVYAIVPGLSAATVAAFDPIYSADYAGAGDINSADGVGKRVWLDAAPGLAAGWYTLLPARYALLPGGMRIVERTEADSVRPGIGAQSPDGTLYVSGRYGDAASGAESSTVHLFDVMPRDTVLAHSRIQITTGNGYFTDAANRDGAAVPRLGIDAGRLILDPTARLIVEAAVKANAAAGGRAAQVDIGGASIEIVSTLSARQPADGVVRLTAGSLTNLNAGSLLIGGIRTDNDDGTTDIDVVARHISVANDAAHPLTAPEIVLVVDAGAQDPQASSITIAGDAVIVAAGTLNDGRTGDYVIDARASTVTADDGTVTTTPSAMTGEGAILRIANGPERLVSRLRDGTTQAAPAATLSAGAARLDGQSVLLDSTGDLSLASAATVAADAIAIGAGKVTFTDKPQGLDGLVVTPALRDRFAAAERFTIRSTNGIAFDDGLYSLGTMRIDAPALIARQGGTVTLQAETLTLSNQTGSTLAACGGAGSVACGDGHLAITAGDLTVGPGSIRTLGFEGGGVALTATGGIFGLGQGRLDVGSAALDIKTPFIGDRAAVLPAGQKPVAPKMTLASTGAVTITDPTGAGRIAPLAGTPGAGLTIEGGSISVIGTELRATAGILALRAQDGISLGAGAVVAAPGYDKVFGDAVDPATTAAPAGKVTLSTAAGDIDLGAGSLVSVGGGAGAAGTLALSAAAGTVNFNGDLDGLGRTQGGSFSLDTQGAFDLALLGAAANAQGFTHALDIRTRTGDLTLAAGQRLVADSLKLTADGGLLTVAGTLDTSGVTGGDIVLYGTDGVTLAATARIDASADGYGEDDSRQASAGDVTVGTDAAGVITLEEGAVVDVSARRPVDRLVRLWRNGELYYQYVQGDLGGTVRFRAPVIEQAGADTVNVAVADAASIVGARTIALEAFKRWDLAQVAAGGAFKGVTLDEATGTITLDVSAGLDTAKPDGTMTTVSGVNFLGDDAPGTLVEFVQDFDLSGSDAQLGGLAEQDNFHALPGIELAYDGNITLASNWNLGAGVVNVTAAIAAGAMTNLGGGASAVVAGEEADVFSRFTRLTYRTGNGSVLGEAPVLALRAGGDLRLEGSLTDGFFQFQGPIQISGGGDGGDGSGEPFQFAFQRFGGLESLGLYYYVYGFNALANGAPYTILGGGGGGGGGGSIGQGYSASANSPAALTPVDTLATMVPFPVVCLDDACGETTPAATSSYRLVAGAALDSVDPEAVQPSRRASITFNPYKSFEGMSGSSSSGPVSIDLYFDVGENDLFLGSEFPDENSRFVRASELADELGAENIIEIDLGWDTADDQSGVNSRAAWATFLEALDSGSDAELAALVDQYGVPDIFGDGYLSGAAAVLEYWVANYMAPAVAADLPGYFEAFGLSSPFGSGGGGGGESIAPGLARNVVRTGTGSITLAAADDVNLYDPAQALPTYSIGGVAYSEGATAIYTAGRLAGASARTLADPVTGAPVSVVPPALSASDGGYYLTDGGDIRVTAGGNVNSSRATGPKADQAWLLGSVDSVTDLRVAPVATVGGETPKGFAEGIGALGGGDVSVIAGRDVVDLTVTSAGSAATATTDAGAGSALLVFGGGDVTVSAGRDLVGGRIDVWSGTAALDAGGSVTSAGIIAAPTTPNHAIGSLDNGLALRLFDASVSLSAQDTIGLQGIASIASTGSDQNGIYFQANVNSYGFYSERARVDLVANGDVSFVNTASSVLVSDIQPTPTFNTIWPASVIVASLLGDLDIGGGAAATLMMPGPDGNLGLLAGGSITAATLAMLDADPGQLPGYFSQFLLRGDALAAGLAFRFPAVFSSTSDSTRAQQHNTAVTHAGDDEPARIHAGIDIGDGNGGLILSLAEQARISAGRDIVNMMFFGQNVAAGDITRIVAGRDITATTRLVSPATGFEIVDQNYQVVLAEPRPAVLGNTFVLGGPGNLIVEAGRDIGPFLNSVQIEAIRKKAGSSLNELVSTTEDFAGGILTVGNEWNPSLKDEGANISVLFGVAKGADFNALRDYYVDPTNVAITDPADPHYLPDEFFERSDSGTVDRSKPIYGTMLVDWMKQNASDALITAYGGTEVTYAEAYVVFKSLSALRQRPFLTQVYFNELRQFADPDSPSFGQSARGYFAVNRLFPGSLGYTLNGESENDFGAVRSVLSEFGYGAVQLAEGLKFLDTQGYTVTVGGTGFTARLVDGRFQPVEDDVVTALTGDALSAFDDMVAGALLAAGGIDFITARAQTGSLDLRLATIQTARGGDISILGPGGRVIAGSTVRTSEQAARRAYDGGRLFAGNTPPTIR